MYNIPIYNDFEILGPDWRSTSFKFDDEDQIQMVVDWCNENLNEEWTVRIHNECNRGKKSNIMAALLNFDEAALRELGSTTKPIHEAVSDISRSLSDDSEESEFDKFDRFYFKSEEDMMAFKLTWL